MSFQTNAHGAAAVVINAADDFDVFDTLPAPVREALAHCPVKFSAQDLMRKLGVILWLQGAEAVVDCLLSADRAELAAFNSQHIAANGYPLPHVAAQVDALRW